MFSNGFKIEQGSHSPRTPGTGMVFEWRMLGHSLLPPCAHDLMVVSLPEDSDEIEQAIIDPQAVLDRGFGAVHVAVLTGVAAFHLTDRIGKEMSVFQRAVRTYRAGFDLESNEPSQHPLAAR